MKHKNLKLKLSMEIEVYQTQYGNIFDKTERCKQLVCIGKIMKLHPLYLIVKDESDALHYISLSKYEVEVKKVNC